MRPQFDMHEPGARESGKSKLLETIGLTPFSASLKTNCVLSTNVLKRLDETHLKTLIDDAGRPMNDLQILSVLGSLEALRYLCLFSHCDVFVSERLLENTMW